MEYSVEINKFIISLEFRDKDKYFSGRFTDGFDYAVGIKFGKKTIKVNLLTGSLTIYWN